MIRNSSSTGEKLTTRRNENGRKPPDENRFGATSCISTLASSPSRLPSFLCLPSVTCASTRHRQIRYTISRSETHERPTAYCVRKNWNFSSRHPRFHNVLHLYSSRCLKRRTIRFRKQRDFNFYVRAKLIFLNILLVSKQWNGRRVFKSWPLEPFTSHPLLRVKARKYYVYAAL